MTKRQNSNVLQSTTVNIYDINMSNYTLPSDADSNGDFKRTGPSTSELPLAAVMTLPDHLVLQRW